MSKNLCPEANLSFTSSASRVKFTEPLAVGTYTISAVVMSSDIDSSTCLVLFTCEDASTKEVYISRSTDGERVSKTFELTSPSVNFRAYASESRTLSEGDTATYSNIQIESGSVATDYEEYEEPKDPSAFTYVTFKSKEYI